MVAEVIPRPDVVVGGDVLSRGRPRSGFWKMLRAITSGDVLAATHVQLLLKTLNLSLNSDHLVVDVPLPTLLLVLGSKLTQLTPIAGNEISQTFMPSQLCIKITTIIQIYGCILARSASQVRRWTLQVRRVVLSRTRPGSS